ncbi:MAG: flavodoxin family protein [Solobacterium sp.]|jgi:multimeric flavodoxin WrbA|nr:flavodoxin family protein [Solobacterium sp.]MCH4222733.1 flavodoxin family protein [Solobacterium sp.]MCH4266313.1 flavodoxin family protein [Solobacterium sp.]
MKVMMINGSPHEHGCTYAALHECEKTLNSHGIDTEIVWLGNQAIHGCIACGKCGKTDRCVFDDKVNEVAAQTDSFDGLIVGAPVYYGGPCSQIVAFMDRLFYSAGNRLKDKPASSVVSCRRGGASSAYERLNKYFEMSNMPVVTSQYWNQIHGNTPEEALQDEEGLQTMRTLGENMAWLLACIEAGKKAGVPLPSYEPKRRTNFIR